MIVIPAIDLIEGKVVRLYQGRFEQKKGYSVSAEEVAGDFYEQGANLIHLVDLEGARAGKPTQKELVLRLAKKVPVDFELGGGIREMDTVREYLEGGIKRVILGTVAEKNQGLVEEAVKEFPGRIMIGIDARKGMVAVSGWEQETGIDAVALAKRFDWKDLGGIIYTEIERDGTLQGPELKGLRRILDAVQAPVIASGGISSLEDLLALKAYEELGLEGVIVGKALYEGRINLLEVIKAVS